MRKKNNNMRRGGGHGGGGRRFNGGHGGGGGGNRNDGQNIARQKHHATQMREKYTNMARDAQNNGDRVDVEYYLQHVEHYNRVLNDIAVIEAERFAAQREAQPAPQGGEQAGDAAEAAGNDDAADAGDDAGEPITPGNQPRMTRGPRRPHPQHAAQQGEPAAQEIPLPDSALTAI